MQKKLCDVNVYAPLAGVAKSPFWTWLLANADNLKMAM